MNVSFSNACLLFLSSAFFLSCSNGSSDDRQLQSELAALNLKKGTVISCGPPAAEFGKVEFNLSCPDKVKAGFNQAVAMLHSFEYDEAEKAFAKVIEQDPRCPMAYWGVAMSTYHALWSAPDDESLQKGKKAIEIAQSLKTGSPKEKDYIDAIAVFYKNTDKLSHNIRAENYKKEMEKLYNKYPDDKEAAIFYALALNATADPADKTFTNQKKAGKILTGLFPGEPTHPGIAHYIIHNYDYPELAAMALPAARKYASIAPSSAHAQHMPSHIFTRLGLWDEDIQSNLKSVSSAVCYAESAGIKGHWDEELHGLDYLEYAYLQKGQDELAKSKLDYLATIKQISPANFKVAYAFAAMPSRYYLEKKMWDKAARLEVLPTNLTWEKFPWQKAIVHFTRLLGLVHMNQTAAARTELQKLDSLRQVLQAKKNSYEANQVLIQMKTGEAWILLREDKKDKAIQLMMAAADMEEATGKHPVTPGEVLPARELLADMYMETGDHEKALEAYAADLKTHPGRLNALCGAITCAKSIGNKQLANEYYTKLLEVAKDADKNKEQIAKVRSLMSRS